jgi:hypothetical protein
VGDKMHKPINKNHNPPYPPERENQGLKKPYRRLKNRDFVKGIELDSWLEIENEFSSSNRVSNNYAK